MTDLLSQTSLFAVVLTLGAYELGLWLQKKLKSPLCNPILVAVILVVAVLPLTGVTPGAYKEGCEAFSWLLTPATVCLAVPLYEQIKVLGRNLPAIFAGVLAGTAASLLCVVVLCRVFAMEEPMLASLLPKSITTAMGIAVSEQLGGIPAVTTAVIIITGILGNIFGSGLCRLLKLDDPIAQGVAFGTASHVVGTSRASEISELTGAVSSLSLVVAGILTALLCPAFFSIL